MFYDPNSIMAAWKYEEGFHVLMDAAWQYEELKFLTQMSATDQREWYSNMLKTFDVEVVPLLDDESAVTSIVHRALLVKEYRKVKNKRIKGGAT